MGARQQKQPYRRPGAQLPLSSQSKEEKAKRLTQDGEVRLELRGLTAPGTASNCDGANSSFGEEIKIRWVQHRVKCATGISLQTLQQFKPGPGG